MTAIGSSTPTDGARRALLACRLLSEAILDHRKDQKLLSLVRALEVLVLVPRAGSQTFRLARRLAFLACGNRPGEALCGRGRPTCPYLAIDPAQRSGTARLKELRARAAADVAWRCSEWDQIVEWYEVRSDAAHAGISALSPEEVSKIEYWVVRHLAMAALDWLAANPDDPVERLDAAIDALPEPPDWEQIIAAGVSPEAATS